MRRLTKAQPIGGASLCSFISSFGVFRRQRIGNGGEQLRHLHDRALQPAERRGKFERVAGAIERHAEKARAGKARGDAAHLRADAGVAPGAGGEAIAFAVVWGHRRAHRALSNQFWPEK